MRKLITDNLLLLVLLACTFLGCVLPGAGTAVERWHLVPAFAVAVFFCQGASVDMAAFRQLGAQSKALLLGFLLVHALGPLLGLATARLLGWQGDLMVGMILVGCMAPTPGSSTVITAQAHGNRAMALMLTVTMNMLAVVMVPFNLRWALGANVSLDSWTLLGNLVIQILIPAIVGQLWRRHNQERALRHAEVLRLGSILFLGLIVFAAVASQTERLKELDLHTAVKVMVPSFVVHYLILALGYVAARYLARLHEADCRAIAIVCSQKTISLSAVVFAMVFSKTHPLAIVPCILFYFSQVCGDGFLVQFWARRPIPPAPPPKP